MNLLLQKEAQAELHRRKSKKVKKKKHLQHSPASAAATATVIDVNGAGGGRISAVGATATGVDSDGVAEAVHNGEVAGDILDEKDSKRGLWKSVKDLRRMLRLVSVLIAPSIISWFFGLSSSHPTPYFSELLCSSRTLSLFHEGRRGSVF